jgi:succinoglycan biosynthesis transport protein ExoP
MNSTLRDLLNIIFRYLNAILIFTVAIILVAGAYYFLGKKTYISTANILIRLGQEQTGGMTISDSKSNVIISRREQEITNEIQILTSGDVVTAAAKDILGPQATPQQLHDVSDYLSKKIAVKFLYDSDTMQVSFSFPNPRIAKRLLEIYLNEYIRHHISVYKDDKETPFLQTNLAESRRAYDQSLSKLTDFVGSHKLYDDKQLIMLIEQREKMRQELSVVNADNEYNSKKEERLTQVLKILPHYQDYSTVEVRNSLWTKLQSRLNEARIEREALAQRYTKTSRLVKDIDQEINLLESLIQKEPERVVDQQDRRASEVYDSLNKAHLNLGPEISGLKAKAASLSGDISRLEAEIDEASRNARTYEILKKDSDLAKSTYEKYYQGYVESSIRNSVSTSNISNISVIEQPSLPDRPSRPDKKKTLIYTFLLLIMGNTALVLLLHLTDQTFSLPSQLDQLGVPVLGVIPWAGGSPFQGGTPPRLFERMASDFLRLFLNLRAESGPAKIILLAKSYDGEGAATVGFNLSQYIASSQGRNVAFISTGRNPLFRQLEEGAGTSAFGHAEMGGITVFQHNPAQPLDAANFSLLDEIRDEFDYIFIAIPPVNMATELVYLGKLVDKVIFIVEAERTNREVVRHNLNIIRQSGSNDIGLVLNKRRYYIPKAIYGMI